MPNPVTQNVSVVATAITQPPPAQNIAKIQVSTPTKTDSQPAAIVATTAATATTFQADSERVVGRGSNKKAEGSFSGQSRPNTNEDTEVGESEQGDAEAGENGDTEPSRLNKVA